MNRLIIFGVFILQALWATHASAACDTPPAIGWPEGGVDPVVNRGQTYITINYHDQCSNDQLTTVAYKYNSIYGSYTEIKRDGAYSAGWRQATANGLSADKPYKFRVQTLGGDNVWRTTYGTFRTTCPPPSIGDSSQGREAVVSKGPTHIEIQYDDRCSADEYTQVMYKRSAESEWTLFKTDQPGSGWRTARIEGLIPEQRYIIKIVVKQQDGPSYYDSISEDTSPLTTPCE